jgi:arylsulfatase A-like enzyme
VLLVVADDLGWGDVGAHGGEIETPSLDRLFREGLELRRFYVSPVCSPTRAALLTGRSPVDLGLLYSGVPPWSPRGLPAAVPTLADRFRAAGYETALVGKWHLGHARPEHGPRAHGFDHFYGFLGAWIDHLTHREGETGTLDWQRDGESLLEEGHSTQLLGAEALRRLEARDPRRPLFLLVAFAAPHLPLQAPEAEVARYAHLPDPRRQRYAAMVAALDRELGRLLAALDRQGRAEATLVVFLSDNGALPEAGGRNAPLRGEKFTTLEGGIRVPAAMRWKGRLPAGAASDQLMRDFDLFPTLLAAAGLGPAAAVGAGPAAASGEGLDLWPVLRGEAPRARQTFFFATDARSVTWRAAIDGDWKLVTTEPTGYRQARTPQLFHLGRDPGERDDLAPREPERVAELERRISAWEARYPADGIRYSEAPAGFTPPRDLNPLARPAGG